MLHAHEYSTQKSEFTSTKKVLSDRPIEISECFQKYLISVCFEFKYTENEFTMIFWPITMLFLYTKGMRKSNRIILCHLSTKNNMLFFYCSFLFFMKQSSSVAFILKIYSNFSFLIPPFVRVQTVRFLSFFHFIFCIVCVFFFLVLLSLTFLI